MKGKTMWMVRSATGGRLADAFVEANLIAIGWADIGDLNQYKNKSEILSAIKTHWPDWSDGRCISSASQLERFRSNLEKDDLVITYDSGNRIYRVGTITGDYHYNPDQLAPFVRAC